jgi:predicted NBD/HSP70 family sugar kinase
LVAGTVNERFRSRRLVPARLGRQIDNDANLVSLLWFGAGSYADFAVVTIEHGAGSALNRIYRGGAAGSGNGFWPYHERNGRCPFAAAAAYSLCRDHVSSARATHCPDAQGGAVDFGA